MGCDLEPQAVRLWVESAYVRRGRVWIGTFQTENLFTAVQGLMSTRLQPLAADAPWEEWAQWLRQIKPNAFALLQVCKGREARFLARDWPAPLWIRGREVLDIPLKACELGKEGTFALTQGDYAVVVSSAYLALMGQELGQLGEWVRRWAETGCDAVQLRDCLWRTAQRRVQAASPGEEDLGVLAMRVRPLVSATVWTGPPGDPQRDHLALDMLMAEPGLKIICGDTTAQIAARLLGRALRVDQGDLTYRSEVPPISHLEGVDLVTEGLITMRHALAWMRGAETIRGLPRRMDASTRLAYLLLSADRIRFLVGGVVNPAQEPGSGMSRPLRWAVVQELASELRRKGKIVDIVELG